MRLFLPLAILLFPGILPAAPEDQPKYNVLFLISDDNFSNSQRTLLMAFAVGE